MHIDKFFDDRYLRAGHLDGQDRILTILKVERETVGTSEDIRPVIYFTEQSVKPMVCNKTNASRIVDMHGTDADAWTGKRITVYESETDFSGKVVPCVRVRPAPPNGQPQAAEQPTPVDQPGAYWVRVQNATTIPELLAIEGDAYTEKATLTPADLDGIVAACAEKKAALLKQAN